MKIDYCLIGSNTDPLYLDFWPIVSKVWKEVFNITPVLGLICDEDSELYSDEFGMVKKFKKSEFSDSGCQSQVVRMYLSKFLDGNCIISDIDMIPLSKKYFIDDLEKFKDDDVIVMSSTHPQTVNTNQYPMCYIAGDSKIFDKIFKTNVSWDEFVKETCANGWYSDQLYLYKCIQEFGLDTVKFPYRSFNNDRVDRAYWSYDDKLVTEGHYVDCHSLRPYHQYKSIINNLISLL